MAGKRIAQPLLFTVKSVFLCFFSNINLLHFNMQKKQHVLIRLKPALFNGEAKTRETFLFTTTAKIINGKNSHITERKTTAIEDISAEKNGGEKKVLAIKNAHKIVANVFNHGMRKVFTICKIKEAEAIIVNFE